MGSLAAPKIFVRRCRQHVHTSTLPFWISSISGGISRRGVVGSTTTRHFHEKDNYLSYDAFDDSSSSTVDDDPPSSFSSLRIPTHAAHKVCTPSDAVSLISRGDTIAYVHISVMVMRILCFTHLCHCFNGNDLYCYFYYRQCQWLRGTRITGSHPQIVSRSL